MKKIILLLFCCVGSFYTFAQSPPDLNNDIQASAGLSTVANIETSFNNARRQEEMQLGLPANSIKNLDMPDQTTWNGYTDDQKMLFLLNDERTARAGINYPNVGVVKGLPFQGVEKKVDDVAQSYATFNYTNNRFDHDLQGSPWNRIDNALTTACRTFNNYSENLFIAGGSQNSGFTEAATQAVYDWNYVDKGSAWGHRKMDLWQTFTDDSGKAGQEGYIGVGVHRGGAYNNTTDFGQGNSFSFQHGVIMVLNFYDPVADASAGSCGYNVLVSTDDLSGGSCQINNLPIPTPQNNTTYQANNITSDGTVQAGHTVTFRAPQSILLSNGFEAKAGATFTAEIGSCTTTLTSDSETAAVQSTNPLNPNLGASITELQQANLTVFPNPISSNFTINLDIPEDDYLAQIKVYSVTGTLVNQPLSRQYLAKGTQRWTVDSHNWQSGIYLVVLQTENEVISRKLIK